MARRDHFTKIKRLTAWTVALVFLLGMLPAALADTSPATDTYCPATGAAHSWSRQEITRQPTCTGAGQRVSICGRCGYEKYETIPAAGHSWGKWKTVKEATCTEKGEETRKCRVCGKKETRGSDKKPHAYGEWTVTKEASCVETGSRTRTCSVCGHVDEGVIDLLPHSWGDWEILVEATDHSSGTRSHTCQVCGAQETVDYDPDGTLRRGAKGDAVKRLQEGLICYGARRRAARTATSAGARKAPS